MESNKKLYLLAPLHDKMQEHTPDAYKLDGNMNLRLALSF